MNLNLFYLRKYILILNIFNFINKIYNKKKSLFYLMYINIFLII